MNRLASSLPRAVLLSLALLSSAVAQEPLQVGTKVAEPFAMRSDDGEWYGISIDLWERVAERQGWEYEYRELTLPEMIAGTADGSLDLAVAAITATPEREAQLDFSHSFYSTGLGIAVPSESAGLLNVFTQLLSPEFLGSMSILVLVLLFVGLLIWALERRKNPEHFGGGALSGIGSGFWWSAVTMTTVGYGDKAPVTFWGRGLGFLWMFLGIVLISTFTAAITSALTVNNLRTDIRGPEDLHRMRVGTLANSAPETSLRDRGVNPTTYSTLDGALQSLAGGDLDAVVYDAPILTYSVRRNFGERLRVLPQVFERQDYALALPPESELREPLNREILEEIRSPEWKELLTRYLGPQP